MLALYKNNLRRWILQKLQQDPRKDQVIRQRLIQAPLWKISHHIGLYSPLSTEIDLLPLLSKKKQFYFPVISGSILRFGAANNLFKKGSLGILEPEGKTVSVSSLDLLIVPILAFNSNAYRLGRGKGYYDRTILKTPTIGAAYQSQHMVFCADSWDIPMRHIATEQGWI